MAFWKRICCAVDFSTGSREALELGAELARGLDAELVLAHVHRSLTPGARAVALSSPELLEAAASELHRKLERWRLEAERLAGRPVRCSVLSGDPALAILHLAATTSLDAVVIGARRGEPLGSLGRKLVRDGTCPVVVAPSRPRHRAAVAA
jgi:nucleotide-binding universal stress UspA family protein